MPRETRMKEKGMMRQERDTRGLGGIFCPICGFFFDDKYTQNKSEYVDCKIHTKLGLKGFKLYDIL